MKNNSRIWQQKKAKSVGSPAALSEALIPAPTFVPLAKLRPWLQDFNMGADYTADMVKQEIKATQDSLGSDYLRFYALESVKYLYADAVIKDPQPLNRFFSY